ncbi:hypothetical protein [Vagococcus fluvialis]
MNERLEDYEKVFFTTYDDAYDFPNESCPGSNPGSPRFFRKDSRRERGSR